MARSIPTFQGSANDNVWAIAVQSDGKILVGGRFAILSGQERFFLGRLNTDGTLDASFQPVVPLGVLAMVVQPDGKVVVGGGGYVARVHANGAHDFSVNADDSVWSVGLSPDGRIVMGGVFTQVESLPRARIARLNANGTVDSTFNPGTNDSVRAIVFQADGRMMIGGWFSQVGGQGHASLARFNADGSLDSSYHGATNGQVWSLCVQRDGKILVGGNFGDFGNQLGDSPRIGRLNANGSVDTSFRPHVDDTSLFFEYVFAIAQQSDNKIMIGGEFDSVNFYPHNWCARLYPDGSSDENFNPGANNTVRALAQQGNQIVAGGSFTQLGGQTRNRMGRLNGDGALDPNFNPNADGDVNAILVEPDGKLVVAGAFTNLGGNGCSRIGRLNSNGTFQGTFAGRE